MFRNLEAEQTRKGLTNQQVADEIGISRISYERKKRNGYFTRIEIVKLLKFFNCDFFYLFATDDTEKTA